jgi:hypothetical protein
MLKNDSSAIAYYERRKKLVERPQRLDALRLPSFARKVVRVSLPKIRKLNKTESWLQNRDGTLIKNDRKRAVVQFADGCKFSIPMKYLQTVLDRVANT